MEPTRRAYLIAVAATVPLAGCASDDADDADDAAATDADEQDDGESPNDEDVPDDEAEPADDEDAPDDNEDDVEEDAEAATAIQVGDHDELGEILVDGDGMVLYMFDADEQGAGASTCYDGCEENWPPFVVDDPEPSEDVTADLSTFERDDGSMQLAADGWPLYYFAGDEEPGDAEGQGANDVWWVLRPDGSVHRGEDGVGTEENDENGLD